MALVTYEPWVGVRQLQDDINRLFSGWKAADSSGVTADWVPNVDINEFEDKFQLYVDLPGVDPKDVEITLEAGVLTLTGQRFLQAEITTTTSCVGAPSAAADGFTGASFCRIRWMPTASPPAIATAYWRS